MATPAQLTEAWDLLFSGRFRDSLAPFSQAASDFRWAAEALYGTGVAQLSLNEDVYAEAALWDSLQRAPGGDRPVSGGPGDGRRPRQRESAAGGRAEREQRPPLGRAPAGEAA